MRVVATNGACQTVHVKLLVGGGCSFSIFGMEVTGQKLGLLATSLESPLFASFCTHRHHFPVWPGDDAWFHNGKI